VSEQFLNGTSAHIRLLIIIIIITMTMFMVLSSWHSHCESSLGSYDECRLSAGWPPTLRPNQPIWAVSPPIGCYHPQTPSPFIIITQLVNWYSFYRPTEDGRLSRPIGTAVRVHNPCPRLYIAVTVVINTTGRDEIRTWVSHYSVPNYHCMADLHKGGGDIIKAI